MRNNRAHSTAKPVVRIVATKKQIFVRKKPPFRQYASHHRPGGEVIRSSSRELGLDSCCASNCEGTCVVVVDDAMLYVMAGQTTPTINLRK